MKKRKKIELNRIMTLRWLFEKNYKRPHKHRLRYKANVKNLSKQQAKRYCMKVMEINAEWFRD